MKKNARSNKRNSAADSNSWSKRGLPVKKLRRSESHVKRLNRSDLLANKQKRNALPEKRQKEKIERELT